MRDVYAVEIPDEGAFVPAEARNYITTVPPGEGWELVGCVERHELDEEFCRTLGLAYEGEKYEYTRQILGNLDEAKQVDGHLKTRKVMCHRALFRRKILPNVAE